LRKSDAESLHQLSLDAACKKAGQDTCLENHQHPANDRRALVTESGSIVMRFCQQGS